MNGCCVAYNAVCRCPLSSFPRKRESPRPNPYARVLDSGLRRNDGVGAALFPSFLSPRPSFPRKRESTPRPIATPGFWIPAQAGMTEWGAALFPSFPFPPPRHFGESGNPPPGFTPPFQTPPTVIPAPAGIQHPGAARNTASDRVEPVAGWGIGDAELVALTGLAANPPFILRPAQDERLPTRPGLAAAVRLLVIPLYPATQKPPSYARGAGWLWGCGGGAGG